MKQFVKYLNKVGSCILSAKFTWTHHGQTPNAVIYDGPQIKHFIIDARFIISLNEIESSAWSLFVLVVKNSLGLTQ